MLKHFIHQNWTVEVVGDLSEVPAEIRGKKIPATVPGCVHTDLLAAGLIDDPYLDRNEWKVQWIGRTDWKYSCTFDAGDALLKQERIDLVCEGLDTIARVELNGHLLAESFSQHLPQRFDVKKRLRPSGNELVVTFASALKYAEAKEKEFGALPHVEKHPFNFIRKMACNFGWDWGPTLITAGIWQPISLEGWGEVRLASVRPLVVDISNNMAVVDVHVDVVVTPEVKNRDTFIVEATLKAPDGKAAAQHTVSLADIRDSGIVRLVVKDPQLWWPRGHGAQPLYALNVQAKMPQDEIAGSEWNGRIGLRTTKLDTSKDEIGSRFTILVNDKPIFCKGANWIPDDCFPHRVDAARYRERLQQACDANMNMLRIWGGGIFETNTFYSLCDEMGLMVWQDFLFACAAYPEEEPYYSLVEAEARYHVSRLSCHPSLVIWNGCNENIWGYFDWGWKEKIGSRTWGLGYYLQLLPLVIAELDPTRPYWPASPYSGSMEIAPLDDNHGNKHVWDAWNQKDYLVYRNYIPRFCSEFGHQAPPTYATLRTAVPPSQLKSDSPTMLHHQKANGGNDKLHARLQEHFNLPDNFDDWLYVTQLNQARAIQTGVEWWRSQRPRCMGALYWQINDCWPVTSWAAIDGEGRPKPLWYATKRFFADRLLVIVPEKEPHNSGDHLFLAAINDTVQEWSGTVFISSWNFDLTPGRITNAHCDFNVAAHSSERAKLYGEPFGTPAESQNQFLIANFGAYRAFWYFDTDKNLHYPEPKYDAEVSREGTRYRVKITAKTFLRDLALFADRLDPDAVVNDQLITLLPRESFTFEFDSKRQLPDKALTEPPVLQCANRFGARET